MRINHHLLTAHGMALHGSSMHHRRLFLHCLQLRSELCLPCSPRFQLLSKLLHSALSSLEAAQSTVEELRKQLESGGAGQAELRAQLEAMQEEAAVMHRAAMQCHAMCCKKMMIDPHGRLLY